MPRDSLFQNSKSNTGIILLLLSAGLVILGVAGFIILKQRNPPRTPASASRPSAPRVAAPLVVSQPGRPLQAPVVPDAGVEKEEKEEKPKGRTSKSRGGKFGTIDAQAVSRFMNARFGQVKACYERRLKTNSFLEGILDINIEIRPDGRVAGISINKDTVRDPEMTRCVKRVVRGWQFPKPDGGRVIVAKKFNFQKKG